MNTSISQVESKTEEKKQNHQPYRHMLGLHFPLSRAFGQFSGEFIVPFARVSNSKITGAPNSSIGLHYMHVFSERILIGPRFSLHKYNSGGEMSIGSGSATVYEPILCFRIYAGKKKFAVPIEISGGPQFAKRMRLNPANINYSSPYDAYIWFRGSVANFKLGFPLGDLTNGNRFYLGFQGGTYTMNAYRFEIDGPVPQASKYSSTFNGFHFGIFFDFSQLLH
jgi:hypothetical protein